MPTADWPAPASRWTSRDHRDQRAPFLVVRGLDYGADRVEVDRFRDAERTKWDGRVRIPLQAWASCVPETPKVVDESGSEDDDAWPLIDWPEVTP